MSDCVTACAIRWGQLWLSVCVAVVRLTCWAQASGSLLWLCGSVAVLLATFPTSGAGGANMHFTDFEERHHERLLLQRSVTSYEPRLLGVDALPCFKRHGTYKLYKARFSLALFKKTKTYMWCTLLPLLLSTLICRPRLCTGLITHRLLVAVMSNSSQPSSAAHSLRESSRNRSASLGEHY